MTYTEHYYQSRAAHPVWQSEARWVARLAGPAGRGTVVDAGCGSGELLDFLRPQHGIGLDMNAAAIAMAAQRSPQYEFAVADACRPAVEAGSVDCIVSMHLIEHLPNLVDALQGWNAALRSGGALVLVTPNADFAHPEAFDDPDHKHIYRGPELAEVVTQHGFRAEHAFTMGLWGWRSVPRLWRVSHVAQTLRLPAWPLLRWRGQSLILGARKER